MSAVASGSNNSEVRLQAGPLPSKRGEIGYDEEIHRAAAIATPEPAVTLPERHPADRDAPPAASTTAPTTTAPSTTTTSEASSSTTSLVKRKRKRDMFRFKNRKIPNYGGIMLTTFLQFLFQLFLMTGTIVGWALAVRSIQRATDNGALGEGPMAAGTSAIFVHVVFGIAVLGQLLFLERKVYRLRAERYAFLHPGEILPSSRSRYRPDPNIGLSPWNRPPLPTYAAALAQSGHGTGDVEDNLIAAPPPPAYGNTRGSTLLLAGFLRNSLRAQRPSSMHSDISRAENGERPMSYHSSDEEWEEIQNAERARKLEETLARLERPASRT